MHVSVDHKAKIAWVIGHEHPIASFAFEEFGGANGAQKAASNYIEGEGDLSCACCGGSGHKDDVWKPLETMPKDGRMFLVCLPRMMGLVVRCWYNKTHGYFSTDMDTDGGITRPTYFHKNEQYGDDVWANIPDVPAMP